MQKTELGGRTYVGAELPVDDIGDWVLSAFDLRNKDGDDFRLYVDKNPLMWTLYQKIGGGVHMRAYGNGIPVLEDMSKVEWLQWLFSRT